MADANTNKIKIKNLALFVRNVQINPGVSMSHVKALVKTSCKYPIRRIEININYIQDMLVGQIPKRLIIGCVDSDALNGTITKNPFNFH